MNAVAANPDVLYTSNDMIERTTYEKAPITEAILDLRVVPCSGLELDTLKRLCEENKTEYPQIDKTIEATGMMQIQPGVSASASAQQQQTGFRSISSDGKFVCQRQLQGFTFSRLAPYESWKPFRDLARSLWHSYREATSPQSVARLALRYVNRIDVPETPIDLKDYFRTSPEISSDLPQIVDGFFMQVRLPQEDIGATAILNQTIVPPALPEVVSVILDIDLFCDESVPDDDCAIWDYFETLHTRKNEIFEACITKTTRELFT
jgi:uncharacterized protein (TIGR04255 family)